MAEFEISGRNYKSGKLNAKQQFHIARRIAPIMKGFATLFSGGAEEGAPIDFAKIAPVIDALAEMDDATLDYVLDRCLGVVDVQTGQNWTKLTAQGGVLMIQLDVSEMLQIAWRVIEENLGGFLSAIPSKVSETGQAA